MLQLPSAELFTNEDRPLIGIFRRSIVRQSPRFTAFGARTSSQLHTTGGLRQQRQRPRTRPWILRALRPLLGSDMIYDERPWKEIAASLIIVDWLTNGFVIKFCQEQQSLLQVPNRCMSAKHQTFITNHLQELLKQDAIEKVDIPPRCISPVAVVPKKNGKLLMTLNLKQLKQKVQTPRFRYENLSRIHETLQPGDWCTSIDLKNGFCHIPIHPRSRTYLGFEWVGVRGNFFR